MTKDTAEVLICGAGIAGIAAAYHLAVRRGVPDVLLVDPRPPLTLTSDKSMECYRNWWPGPGDAMVQLMNRSIDLLEEFEIESGGRLQLNRRGYLYATADPAGIDGLIASAEESARLGAGPLRYHHGRPGDPEYIPAPPLGWESQPAGADLLLDPALIQQRFPYLSPRTCAAMHARRCGWFSGQGLGMYLLDRARERGVQLISGRVESVEIRANRVRSVRVAGRDGSRVISTPQFVSAAGPLQAQVGKMLDLELPIFCELHIKAAFNDHLGVVAREAPLIIWLDPVRLPWSEDERSVLEENPEVHWLLEEFPPGAHTRPEGGPGSSTILMQWSHDIEPREPIFPLPRDPNFADIVLRGLSDAIPGLAAYFGRAPKPYIDGGYYAKTRENRPLIGPLPVDGTHILGGLSGFGLQAAAAGGELLAAHLTGAPLPAYAPAFLPDRYENPEYLQLLADWGATGQI